MDKIPRGAIGALDGLYHKVGANNVVFYWNDGSWFRSAKDALSVVNSIMSKRDKFSMMNAYQEINSSGQRIRKQGGHRAAR